MHERGSNTGAVIGTIALLIAIIALVLAWVAYDRTGGDLDQRIKEGVEQSAATAQDGTQRGINAIDAGPDGVDEDNTDVNSGTTTPPDATMPEDTSTTTP